MSRKYEAMIVLDMKGKEENVDTLVSQLGRDFEQGGAKLEQVDNLGKKKFPYAPRHVESGYYINFLFEAAPEAINGIQGKLKLNDNIYQQYFQRR
ncbi:MAG: 30S ribosomal protein S6 [Verrucomicrobium sp.]|nr:30S ribosomal protein S6 [Verrucomicrobium sp.]